jgi:hypothetical protein
MEIARENFRGGGHGRNRTGVHGFAVHKNLRSAKNLAAKRAKNSPPPINALEGKFKIRH